MTETELLTAYLAKTLNVAESELSQLVQNDSDEGGIKEDALQNLLKLDEGRVAKLKGTTDPVKLKEINDNFYKKGIKEGLEGFEKQVKEKFAFETELKGVELLTALVDANKGTGKPEQLTDDDVKRHKLYQDLMQDSKSKVAEVEEKWKGELEAVKSNYQREAVFSKVKDKAMSLVTARKPILPKDAVKAQNQLNLVLDKLNSNKFDIQGDRFLVMDADGKVLEDNHGHTVNFNDYVHSIADNFLEFEEAQQRSSTGAGAAGSGTGPDGKGAKKWNGATPKTEDEYMEAIKGAKTPEERKAITTAYFGEG